ncbi:diguanylate cyclase [Bacillus salitolerans]|uniref:Diguanylate cyclase n=1 Tax=Bacillus salitolerans TaxID=1437434 RepID=A0ABW4LY15_9BACI
MERNQMEHQSIKGILFDLLINDDTTTRPKLITSFVKLLQRFFSADIVTLFTHVDLKNQFIPESSTNMHIMTNPGMFVIEQSSPLYNYLVNGKPYKDTCITQHAVYLPIIQEKEISYIVSLQFSSLDELTIEDSSWEFVAEVCGKFLEKSHKLVNLYEDERRYEQLYRVTSKFHSSMKMDDVLNEVIQTLREVYPDFTYYLLLSHDNKNLNNLPIKELQYDDSNLAAAQAYVTGDLQLEDALKDRRSILYAPLKGKQGVYGVLQVMAPNTLLFPKQEINFIMLLANTAGSALENAQLYEQSKRVIVDLQLINETSHQLNSNLRLTEAMTFMSKQIVNSFFADEVGFILFDEKSENKLLPGSTGFFLDDNSKEFVNYLYSKINIENEPIFVGDVSLDPRSFQHEFKSVMAVPMIQSGILRGIAVVLHKEPYYFSFETFKLLQSLIHHSTLAFTNAMLREELEKLVITDHLTKLHSRKYLNEKISKSMETDAYGTFILIDIDNFKQVNDKHGHQVGDEILKQVAKVIIENIREFDVGSRWGGEELAVYLPRVDIEAGIAIAKRLVLKVKEETCPSITISCGVGYWRKGQSDTPITLFKRADEALYDAKENGKDQVSVQPIH